MTTTRATATEKWSFVPFFIGVTAAGLIALLIFMIAAIGFLVHQGTADCTPEVSTPVPTVQKAPNCDLDSAQKKILNAEVARAKAEAKADVAAEKALWLQKQLTKMEQDLQQDQQPEPSPAPTLPTISCDSNTTTRSNCDLLSR